MNTFWDVDWGKDEARGDERLLDYFYSTPDFRGLISGTKRYVIGRKGTGKTAVCEHIRLEAGRNNGWYTADLSFRDFPIKAFSKFKKSSHRDKSQYAAVWTFLLATEFVRLLINNAPDSADQATDL